MPQTRSTRVAALQTAAQRHREVRATEEAGVLLDMCREMSPQEACRFLMGIGICIGGAVESAKTRAVLRKTARDYMSQGYHVEAASILVANNMKTDALRAIRVGLKHHHADNRMDLRVRVRLVDLERIAQALP